MKKEKGPTITNARAINKTRCIVGLIICAIVIVLAIISLTLNISNFYNEDVPEAGLGTLRMYTTVSNIIAAFGAVICLPFQINGLRKNYYKLPKWIVLAMFVGAVGELVTFTIASCVIAPSAGFYYAMIDKSNLFMHLINPVFVVILFTVAISDAYIKFPISLIALIPSFIYSFFYFILVFVTQIWRDHYHLGDLMPWPVAFLAIMAGAFGISQLLRLLHNLTNKAVERSIERYYKESPDYEFDDIPAAIAKLAQEESKYYVKGDEIHIPVDIIKLLSDRYQSSSYTLDILYDFYLENYLANIHKNEKRDS